METADLIKAFQGRIQELEQRDADALEMSISLQDRMDLEWEDRESEHTAEMKVWVCRYLAEWRKSRKQAEWILEYEVELYQDHVSDECEIEDLEGKVERAQDGYRKLMGENKKTETDYIELAQANADMKHEHAKREDEMRLAQERCERHISLENKIIDGQATKIQELKSQIEEERQDAERKASHWESITNESESSNNRLLFLRDILKFKCEYIQVHPREWQERETDKFVFELIRFCADYPLVENEVGGRDYVLRLPKYVEAIKDNFPMGLCSHDIAVRKWKLREF